MVGGGRPDARDHRRCSATTAGVGADVTGRATVALRAGARPAAVRQLGSARRGSRRGRLDRRIRVDVGRAARRGGRGSRSGSSRRVARAWSDAGRRDVGRAPRRMPALPSGVRPGRVPSLAALAAILGRPGAGLPRRARRGAGGAPPDPRPLQRWFRLATPGRVDDYARRNDQPAAARRACSRPYLRWGCLWRASARSGRGRDGGRGAQAWVRQLCWRDFYAHLLLHQSRERGSHELQERYRGALEWAPDRGGQHLAAWQEGRASRSSPACASCARRVDAQPRPARRRLVPDGPPPRLARRRGVVRALLDGEPAQNTGNWRWSRRSEPTRPGVPRYNPARHQERFDPTARTCAAGSRSCATCPPESASPSRGR